MTSSSPHSFWLALLLTSSFFRDDPVIASSNEEEALTSISHPLEASNHSEKLRSSLEGLDPLTSSLLSMTSLQPEQEAAVIDSFHHDKMILEHLRKQHAALKEKRQFFIESLIPKTLSRTAFNSLATQPSIKIKGRTYRIFGISDQISEAQSDNIRKQFKKSLPSGKALYTNIRHVLSREGVSLFSKRDEEICLAVSYRCPTSPIAARSDPLLLNVSVGLLEEEKSQITRFQAQEDSILKLFEKLTSTSSNLLDALGLPFGSKKQTNPKDSLLEEPSQASFTLSSRSKATPFPEDRYTASASEWQETLQVIKKDLDLKGMDQAKTWVAEIPLLSTALSAAGQQALHYVDQILEEEAQKKKFSHETLATYAQAMGKISKAFKTVAHTIKEPTNQTSLLALQQRVNAAYGEELLKLNEARVQRDYNERLAELEVAHGHQEKELERQQEEVKSQLKITTSQRLALKIRGREIAEQLEEAEEAYRATLARLQDPTQSLIEDFYDWKRKIFYDFTKLRLGNYFITYEALALGTVARHPEVYEQLLGKATTLISTVSDAFLPFGGTLAKTIGGVIEGGAELYADKQVRLKAARIGSLYDYKGLEGMVSLSRDVASGLVYRLKDLIVDLTPESLDHLANLATLQMIDYALRQWEDEEHKTLSSTDLLLKGSRHQPSWLKSIIKSAALETEEGRTLDGWQLLTQGQRHEYEEKRFMRVARVFAKQIHDNRLFFLKYAGKAGKTAASLIEF